MFEITGEDIMALDDVDLRELVGRLCKAEVERDGGATSGVHYGGHQKARDGGVDVEVDIDFSLRKGSYIPKSCTFYQVKEHKMTPKAIEHEMCPQGVRRLIFDELVLKQGSYIIVSGRDNVSPSALKDRIKAMKAALGPLKNGVSVDFYDQSRMANWVNDYEPIVAWVKCKLGDSSEGWSPYGNWTGDHDDLARPYIVDKNIRIKKTDIAETMSIQAALEDIRSILRNPGKSVRLTGLSGVGKTRFAQALFEEIGYGPLPQELALYVDFQKPIRMFPMEMVKELLAKKHRKIVIVDNCAATEHHELTRLCKAPKSTVSLLTIEYDVQDGEPEDSEVYQMLPSSNECIVDILKQRKFYKNDQDYNRIALLAGGNARVAIVLAKATKKEKNLNELKDEELFKRIFWQKGKFDDALYKTAEVCSLVYSFSINQNKEKTDEIRVLASLYDISIRDMVRNVNRLYKRQIVQKRSHWRAVLPHALANRLAKEALENLGAEIVLETMNNSSNHMIRSFSKRMSFLHDSKEAQDIFDAWLKLPLMTSPNYWSDVCQYRLEDAAPVIPEQVLSFIEQMYKRDKGEYLLGGFHEQVIVRILSQLAYEPKWFDRSLKILSDLPLKRNKREDVSGFFQIVYSGTYALIDQRLHFVQTLLHHNDENYIQLGIDCLDRMLQCKHQIRYLYKGFESFGMYQRDNGLDLSGEYKSWYLRVIEFITVEMSVLSTESKERVREILGKSLVGFGYEHYWDIIEECCMKFGKDRDWWQGWIGLGNIKKFYDNELELCEKELLDQLIFLIEPIDAVPRMDCILRESSFELEIYFPSEEKINEEIRRLAAIFAENPELLEQLFSQIGNRFLMVGARFGKELAEAESSDSFAPLWPSMCKILDKDLSMSIAVGYLNVKYSHDRENTIRLLDLLENTDKASQAVQIHSILECSGKYLQHILKLLSEDVIDLNCVSHLRHYVISDKIEETEFLDFILKIKDMQHGSSVVLDIFWLYCEKIKSNRNMLSAYAKAVGRIIAIEGIKNFELEEGNSIEYELAEVMEICFVDDNVSKEEIKKLFISLRDFPTVRNKYKGSCFKSLMYPVAGLYVEDFLDIIVGDEKGPYELEREIKGGNGISTNIIDNLNPERVFLWADNSKRRLRVVKLSSGFRREENGQYQWTELARKLLHTEDGKQILEQFAKKIPPMSWSGSRSKIIRERLTLLQELKSDEYLGEIACREIEKMEKEILETEEYEKQKMSNMEEINERFEF